MMVIRLFLLSAFFSPFILIAQSLKITLSPKHQQKLSSIESGHKRMVKFYKFFKKDSARYMRNQEKHYKHVLDSAWRAERKQQRVENMLAKKGIVTDKQLSEANLLNNELTKWWSILKDSTTSDSLKTVAKRKVKELAITRARQYPNFQHAMDKYQLSGDSLNWKGLCKNVPGLDSLSGLFDSDPQKIFKLAEDQTVRQLEHVGGVSSLNSQFAAAEKLKQFPDSYKQKFDQYSDKNQLEQQGKQKAVQEAENFFTNHADKLQAAQAKMSKLMSKYREFSNANDLSSAVKRTSLQGKSFKERIVLGGNFNVVSTAPVSIDFSPQFGYKFNTLFYVGIGANYRATFGDSLRYTSFVSPKNTSIKAFANYNFFKNFFAYAEWEKAGLKTRKNDQNPKQWVNNYFIGVGKKFLIHPKLYLTLTALYNINGMENNPSYPRRFQIRAGFQTSELAFRKKKIYYDPNR